jgi:hypothetical protein
MPEDLQPSPIAAKSEQFTFPRKPNLSTINDLRIDELAMDFVEGGSHDLEDFD